MISCARLAALAFIIGATLSGDARAQIQYKTIALSAQPAPGTPPGVNYSIFDRPTINDTARITYKASLTGPGVTGLNNQALYAGGFAAPQLVARTGYGPPGAPPDVSYLFVFNPVLNDFGETGFQAKLIGSGVTFANDQAIYAGGYPAPQLVARTGDPAPGTPAGVNYEILGGPALNDAGQLAYAARLIGSGVTPTVNNFAIYAGDFASPQLVARTGDDAPGTPAGVKYSGFDGVVINDAGKAAYHATLDGATLVHSEAIYAGDFASPQLVARTGDDAPGTPAGVNYDAVLGVPRLNDANQVAFFATLSDSDVTFANDYAIYAGDFSAPQLVARSGDAAPGTPAGVNYEFLDTAPRLNDAGQVAYLALLVGSGVTSGVNHFAIYAGDFASPQLVARSGDAAPGTPAGVTYADFNDLNENPALNDSGQLVFYAGLTGSGVTNENDKGLFAYDPLIGSRLIVREGELFDVGGGDLRTIDDFGIKFAIGAGDDTSTGLSNDGTLAFQLFFTDGSNGIFTARIPTSGDFDDDGDADGNDFLVWQRGQSPHPLSPTDLAAWESTFGQSSLPATQPVPEPNALLLAGLTLIADIGSFLRKRLSEAWRSALSRNTAHPPRDLARTPFLSI